MPEAAVGALNDEDVAVVTCVANTGLRGHVSGQRRDSGIVADATRGDGLQSTFRWVLGIAGFLSCVVGVNWLIKGIPNTILQLKLMF